MLVEYGVADKSLTRPGRKQALKHVRDARDFNNLETRAVIKFFFFCKARRRRKFTPFWQKYLLACFLPGLAKDLSALLYIKGSRLPLCSCCCVHVAVLMLLCPCCCVHVTVFLLLCSCCCVHVAITVSGRYKHKQKMTTIEIVLGSLLHFSSHLIYFSKEKRRLRKRCCFIIFIVLIP